MRTRGVPGRDDAEVESDDEDGDDLEDIAFPYHKRQKHVTLANAWTLAKPNDVFSTPCGSSSLAAPTIAP